MQYRQESDGKIITLDPALRLGAGGEAAVFALAPASPLAAKIYHQHQPERERKLAAMLRNPPAQPQGHNAIAWPMDLLRDPRNNQCAGFLMPRLSNLHRLLECYNPQTRCQQLPLFTYRYLLQTAYNLAVAVQSLHERGYVIGDVNESNALVAETALVSLVDADSFQVRDSGGRVFRCPVGRLEFTPPELQSCRFAEVDRTPAHDLFGLAVLLFQLLMEGAHPFAGKYTGSGDPPPLEKRIAAGCFPHSQQQRIPYQPMPHALPFDTLPPRLRALFSRCFEEGQRDPLRRPSAQVWAQALDEAAQKLSACRKNTQHVYSDHLAKCPWCARARQLGGRDPFPSPRAVLWRKAVQPPAPPPAQKPLPPAPAPAALAPLTAKISKTFNLIPSRQPQSRLRDAYLVLLTGYLAVGNVLGALAADNGRTLISPLREIVGLYCWLLARPAQAVLALLHHSVATYWAAVVQTGLTSSEPLNVFVGVCGLAVALLSVVRLYLRLCLRLEAGYRSNLLYRWLLQGLALSLSAPLLCLLGWCLWRVWLACEKALRW